MKIYLSSLIIILLGCIGFTTPKNTTYVGSTPANAVVREFLGIPLTDSIDFIRWKLDLNSNHFELFCQYGVAKPATSGFIDEKKAELSGKLTKNENRLYLETENRELTILEVNSNLLHLADHDNNMLIGTGGFSYALSSIDPIKTDEFNIKPTASSTRYPITFIGRTPCEGLMFHQNPDRSGPCEVIKWRIILCTDSLTGKPSYYYYGGNKFLNEPMKKGKWQIITGKNGRIIYQIYRDIPEHAAYLVKGDNNIVFFADDKGQLLVGDKNFSYTLSRRPEQ
jgi:hypothetical protein